MTTRTLEPEVLHKMDAYWRAANYLSVGQIYLYDNPLLKRPLELSDVKPLVVGHWGTTPGQNFIYVHLNRVITKYDLDMFYVAGAGHVEHVQVILRDDPIQVHVDEVLPRRGAPMPDHQRFHVRERQRPLQQRIVVQIDLADRQVVRRPPVRVHLVQ